MKKQLWQSLGGTLDATGAVTLSLGPVPLNERWAIQRIATVGAGALNPVLSLYRNGVSDGYLVEGTAGTTGNRDFSDENSWIIIDEGETLFLRYTGGTSGAGVTVNVGYIKDEIRPMRRRRLRGRGPVLTGASQWDYAGVPALPGQHPTSGG